MITKAYKLVKFIGRRGLLWGGINVTAATSLAVIEFLFSLVLISLFKKLSAFAPGPTLGIMKGLELTSNQLVLALMVIGPLRGFIQFILSHSSNVIADSISVRLRLLLLFEAFSPQGQILSLAKIQNQIFEIYPKSVGFCQSLTQTTPALIQSFILFLILLNKSPQETVIGVSGILIAGIFIRILSFKIRSIANLQLNIGQRLTESTVRAAKNIFLLRVLRTTHYELARLQKATISYISMLLRMQYLSSLVGALPQTFGAFVIAMLIYRQLNQATLPGVTFLAFLYLFIRFVQSLAMMVTEFGNLNANFPFFKISVHHFFSFSKQTLEEALHPASHIKFSGAKWQQHFEISQHRETKKSSPNIKLTPPNIQFNKVSFSYRGHENQVIDQINLTVAAGDQLAILGPSGSGKSTLLALILGMIKPTSGEILIDGKKPEIYFSDPNISVGYVGAEPFLIDGTIRENLLYGKNGHYEDEELWHALEQAHLAQWLKGTTEKLSLFISDAGEGLSTGQKQRLSLARALLGKQNVLILDEASANLDAHTESQIANMVRTLRGKCTTIVVSHREGMIKYISNRLILS